MLEAEVLTKGILCQLVVAVQPHHLARLFINLLMHPGKLQDGVQGDDCGQDESDKACMKKRRNTDRCCIGSTMYIYWHYCCTAAGRSASGT